MQKLNQKNLIFEQFELGKLTLSKRVVMAPMDPPPIQIGLMTNINGEFSRQRFSSGGTAGTVVDVKLIYAAAVKACATAVVLAHNHPSVILGAFRTG